MAKEGAIPQQMERREVTGVIYSDGAGVRVERTTASIHGKTYSIHNINSVNLVPVVDQQANSKAGCGLFLLIAGGLSVVFSLFSIGDERVNVLASVLLSLAMVSAGLFLLRRAAATPTIWKLMFVMSNGEVEAIASTDREAVDRVRSAIEEAMRMESGDSR